MERWLNEQEAAAATGLSKWTMQKLRGKGNGPPFVKVGTAVRYPESALSAWMSGFALLGSTSQTPRPRRPRKAVGDDEPVQRVKLVR